MIEEAQWQYVGRCRWCDSPMYRNEDDNIRTMNGSLDCLCEVDTFDEIYTEERGDARP